MESGIAMSGEDRVSRALERLTDRATAAEARIARALASVRRWQELDPAHSGLDEIEEILSGGD